MKRSSAVILFVLAIYTGNLFATFEKGAAFFRQGDYAQATPIFKALLPVDAQFKTDLHRQARVYLLAMGVAEAPVGGGEDESVREFIEENTGHVDPKYAPYLAAKGFAVWKGWWDPFMDEGYRGYFLYALAQKGNRAAMYLFAQNSDALLLRTTKDANYVRSSIYLEQLVDEEHVAAKLLWREMAGRYRGVKGENEAWDRYINILGAFELILLRTSTLAWALTYFTHLDNSFLLPATFSICVAVHYYIFCTGHR